MTALTGSGGQLQDVWGFSWHLFRQCVKSVFTDVSEAT